MIWRAARRGCPQVCRDARTAAHFLRALRRKVRAKRRLLEGVVDVERALAARTLRDYDDALTAPLHGFSGADDYYDRADVRPHLPNIRVPTLLAQSRDDPLLTGGCATRRPWSPPTRISRRRSRTGGGISGS